MFSFQLTSCLNCNNQGKEFTIERGGQSGASSASAEGCLALAEAAVSAEGVHAPAELAGRNISAFSYFYDRGAIQ